MAQARMAVDQATTRVATARAKLAELKLALDQAKAASREADDTVANLPNAGDDSAREVAIKRQQRAQEDLADTRADLDDARTELDDARTELDDAREHLRAQLNLGAR